MKCIKCGSEPRPSDDYIQYGIDPYIDIGGNGEEHTCAPCKWISVKDRLPEPWEQVLIYSQHDFCESAFYIGVPGKWRVTWNHEMLDADSVTHWMPLPQPPKGE